MKEVQKICQKSVDFYGIVIKMFFKPKEHEPSHIHALYGEHIGIFDLKTLEMAVFLFFKNLVLTSLNLIYIFIYYRASRFPIIFENFS